MMRDDLFRYFSRENHVILNQILQEEGEHRIAVFDADGTLWNDDIGEAFLRRLIQERRLIGVDYSSDIYAHYESRVKQDRCAGYGWAVQLMHGLYEEDI
jgi:hypothetical protein